MLLIILLFGLVVAFQLGVDRDGKLVATGQEPKTRGTAVLIRLRRNRANGTAFPKWSIAQQAARAACRAFPAIVKCI